ncbi:MAG: hypothetical protein M1829_002392 [Trizodia sp. TS-e1964]|nr:MAG: hypothetical protein M1829_002392 [Trizodia sp. TS-e1964]
MPSSSSPSITSSSLVVPRPRIPRLAIRKQQQHDDSLEDVAHSISSLSSENSTRLSLASSMTSINSSPLAPDPLAFAAASRPLTKKSSSSSFFNFFSVREPSAKAFADFQQQTLRAAAVNGSQARVSSARLPTSVPKVNSKWDGVPKVSESSTHRRSSSTRGASNRPATASSRHTRTSSVSRHAGPSHANSPAFHSAIWTGPSPTSGPSTRSTSMSSSNIDLQHNTAPASSRATSPRPDAHPPPKRPNTSRTVAAVPTSIAEGSGKPGLPDWLSLASLRGDPIASPARNAPREQPLPALTISPSPSSKALRETSQHSALAKAKAPGTSTAPLPLPSEAKPPTVSEETVAPVSPQSPVSASENQLPKGAVQSKRPSRAPLSPFPAPAEPKPSNSLPKREMPKREMPRKEMPKGDAAPTTPPRSPPTIHSMPPLPAPSIPLPAPPSPAPSQPAANAFRPPNKNSSLPTPSARRKQQQQVKLRLFPAQASPTTRLPPDELITRLQPQLRARARSLSTQRALNLSALADFPSPPKSSLGSQMPPNQVLNHKVISPTAPSAI